MTRTGSNRVQIEWRRHWQIRPAWFDRATVMNQNSRLEKLSRRWILKREFVSPFNPLLWIHWQTPLTIYTERIGKLCTGFENKHNNYYKRNYLIKWHSVRLCYLGSLFQDDIASKHSDNISPFLIYQKCLNHRWARYERWYHTSQNLNQKEHLNDYQWSFFLRYP